MGTPFSSASLTKLQNHGDSTPSKYSHVKGSIKYSETACDLSVDSRHLNLTSTNRFLSRPSQYCPSEYNSDTVLYFLNNQINSSNRIVKKNLLSNYIYDRSLGFLTGRLCLCFLVHSRWFSWFHVPSKTVVRIFVFSSLFC